MESHSTSDSETDQRPKGRTRRRWLSVFGIGMAVFGILMILKPLNGQPAAPLPPKAAAVPKAVGARPVPSQVGPAQSGPSQAAPSPAEPAPAAPSPAKPSPSKVPLGFSPPTRLQIPAIGVDAPFTQLAADASGEIAPPPADNQNLVGWYNGSASPGEPGTSVVVGHVDTLTGPAVFMGLSSLGQGSEVDVTRADGVTATYVVDTIQAFAKDQFPDDEVYGESKDGQLRLITCGGAYDRTAKDYTENVVVFAHLESWGHQG
ncbi:class F sortase [Kitasatospora sp. NPDC056138]|uniref:class F sortase n=1 Tax=Kitasatospora sp. NPDC056138 TaxID=3345724 RepID=UPI0035DC88F9